MKRRLFSILTVLALCVSMVPFGAAAGEDGIAALDETVQGPSGSGGANGELTVADITSETFDEYTLVGDASQGLDLSTLPTIKSIWTVRPDPSDSVVTYGGVITYDPQANVLTFRGVNHINGRIVVGSPEQKMNSSLTIFLDGLRVPNGTDRIGSEVEVVNLAEDNSTAVEVYGDMTLDSLEPMNNNGNAHGMKIHSNGIGFDCHGRMTVNKCILMNESHRTEGVKAGIVTEDGLIIIGNSQVGSYGYREDNKYGCREPEYEANGGSIQVTSGNMVVEDSFLCTTTIKVIDGDYVQTGSDSELDAHWLKLTGNYNISDGRNSSVLVEKYTADTEFNRTSEEFTVVGNVTINKRFADDLQKEMLPCENVSFTMRENSSLTIRDQAVLDLTKLGKNVNLAQGVINVGGDLILADGYDLSTIGNIYARNYWYDSPEEGSDIPTETIEYGRIYVGETKYFTVEFWCSESKDLEGTLPPQDSDGTKWGYNFKTQLVESGEKAVEPVIPEGSRVNGWYSDNSFQETAKWDFSTPIEISMVLHGEWLEIGQYTVTFHSNGGTEVAPKTLYLGQPIGQVEPTRSGYDFKGWYTDETLQNYWEFDEGIPGNMDLYAAWAYRGGSGGGGGSNRPTQPTTPTNPTTPTDPTTPSKPDPVTANPNATVSTDGSAASATVSTALGNELVQQAVAQKSEEIVISPEITGEVSKTEVTVPAAALNDIAGKTDAVLTVKTPVAQVTLPNEALGSLAKDGGNVTVTAEKTDSGYQLSVTANGQTVGSVSGGVTMTVPHDNCAPGTVAVLVKEDGTREIIRKSLAGEDSVTIPLDGPARIELVDNSKSFQDVSDGSWEKDAVDFVSSHELFNGTSEDTFAPESSMTRGMVAQVLHNLEGNPAQSVSGVFTDVDGNVWYAEAVSWAADKGIVSGYGDGQFGAGDSVSRQDLAVILFRYSGSPDTQEQTLDFTDAGEVSDYAKQALSWAVEEGILNGKGNGVLDPKGQATRAQVAQMLLNYMAAVQ